MESAVALPPNAGRVSHPTLMPTAPKIAAMPNRFNDHTTKLCLPSIMETVEQAGPPT